MSFVNYEVQGAVAILTINRPEALNALNSQVLSDLDEAITKVEADDGVHAVILTGAGRSCVAGAGIGEGERVPAPGGPEVGGHGDGAFLRLATTYQRVGAAGDPLARVGGCAPAPCAG